MYEKVAKLEDNEFNDFIKQETNPLFKILQLHRTTKINELLKKTKLIKDNHYAYSNLIIEYNRYIKVLCKSPEIDEAKLTDKFLDIDKDKLTNKLSNTDTDKAKSTDKPSKTNDLKEAITAMCSHTEDIFYFLLLNDAYFIKNISKYVKEAQSKVEFFLFSNKDACDKCIFLVEEIGEMYVDEEYKIESNWYSIQDGKGNNKEEKKKTITNKKVNLV